MSPSRRRWKFRLRHMLEAINKTLDYTRGMTFNQFRADTRTVDAVARNLLVLGEAARHIPLEVEIRYPRVPWRNIRAMRNVLAHNYERVDLVIIWDTVQRDLPPLVPLLEEVLKEVEE